MVTRLVCVLIAWAVLMGGCTSMHRVPVIAAPAPRPALLPVNPGDDVRITMRDGQSVRFRVDRVEPDVIIALSGTRYEVADIVTLERREFSGLKTTSLILGIPAGMYLFAVIVFAFAGK